MTHTRRSLRLLITTSFFAAFFASAWPALGHGYDPAPVWPLCGYDSSDAWKSTCPSTLWTSAVDDVNDTFGPRLTNSEHDWHFGIDLHAEDQQPVFAVTCGQVEDLDDNGGLRNNQKVVLMHFRDWECPDSEHDFSEFPDCTDQDGAGNCYFTIYDHLSELDTTLAVGDFIGKGQLLGRTGFNTDSYDYEDTPSSYYEHLHFELRDPTGAGEYEAFSTTSRLQRDSVHPHRMLMRADWDDDADNIQLKLKANLTSPAAPTLRATVTIDVSGLDPDAFELDLNRVEAQVFDASLLPALVPIPQFHDVYRVAYDVFETPEREAGTGSRVSYDVFPPFLDMERWVRQYSYADSSAHGLSYARFMSSTGLYSTTFPLAGNGLFVSPFSIKKIDGSSNPAWDKGLDTSSYVWGYHLHVHSAANAKSSDFNGMRIEAANFNRLSSQYQLTINMDALIGKASANALCIKVRAHDVYGNTTPWQTAGSCP